MQLSPVTLGKNEYVDLFAIKTSDSQIAEKGVVEVCSVSPKPYEQLIASKEEQEHSFTQYPMGLGGFKQIFLKNCLSLDLERFYE